jgi:2'-hydroxyisoflavone reductase
MSDVTNPAPLSILILGGTGFIGAPQIDYALARGHRVTVFNRGSKAKIPAGVEVLIGDRAANDYAALHGRTWDVCIDTPTRVPHWVRDAAAVLKGQVGHYIFISTTSVYASDTVVNQDESAPRLQYVGDDFMTKTSAQLAADMSLYGEMKALCEDEVRKHFPNRATILRPGLIVGPGDATDRFTYWPVRVKAGGKVLVPPLNDPLQFIDVRDLAEWSIRLAEQHQTMVKGVSISDTLNGVKVYNAKGPDYALTVGALLNCIRDLTQSSAIFCEASAEFLAANNVRYWSDLPVWLPSEGELAGAHRRSNANAIAAGLRYRPLVETVRDTLAWWEREMVVNPRNLKAGLSTEREAVVLEALK